MVRVTVADGCVGGSAGSRVRARLPDESGSESEPGVGICRAVQDGISMRVVMLESQRVYEESER